MVWWASRNIEGNILAEKIYAMSLNYAPSSFLIDQVVII